MTTFRKIKGVKDRGARLVPTWISVFPKSFLLSPLSKATICLVGVLIFLSKQVMYFLSSQIKIIWKSIAKEFPFLPLAPATISSLSLVDIQCWWSLVYLCSAWQANIIIYSLLPYFLHKWLLVAILMNYVCFIHCHISSHLIFQL